MVIESVLSVNVHEARRLLIALAGRGPALKALSALLGREDPSAFPGAQIVAWLLEAGQESEAPPELRHIALYPDPAALFAACPDLGLVIDLTPDNVNMRQLRALAPDGVSVVSGDLLLRFCAANAEGRLILSGGDNPRKTEKFFALLADQMDGDIFVLDAQGTILDANRHASSSRGLGGGDLRGKNWDDLAREDKEISRESGADCPFRAALKSCSKAERIFTSTMEDGRVRYVRSWCFPVADALGGPCRYLYLRRDVTEQKQLEQRLQRTEKMAAIGELSTYMAHEIRNPLFAIGGFANALLRNASLNDLAREKARIIYDESRRLDLILANILNFARPTEQTMGEFDAGTAARQTMELMTLGSDERGLNVVVDVERDLPKVRGNAENLKQCLINLVKNAMEAMSDGGTLTLKAARDGDFVRITVVDNGPGIPQHLQEEIFNPFFSTKGVGAGLGLAMTRKLIEEMGGRVELESRSDRGTMVSLTLPVALAVSGIEVESAGPAGQDAARAAGPGVEAASAAVPRLSPVAKAAARTSRSDKSPDEDPYA